MHHLHHTWRVNLRWMLQEHPEWTLRRMAQELNVSYGWVKKWARRLRQAAPDDPQALLEYSRTPHHPPAGLTPQDEQRILDIRDHPPEHLGRTPGPTAIRYYLARQAPSESTSQAPVWSKRTIWKVLTRHQRIMPAPKRRRPNELPRAEPMESWQLDFKDVGTVPASPDGKQLHGVEVLNAVDCGTSLLLGAQASASFTAESTIMAVIDLFAHHGLPTMLTIDRDPRWVGSAQGSDFPSAFRRCCAVLGIALDICPPHRPDRNGFVERYHRTYQEECLLLKRPGTLEEVKEVTADFQQHYNRERPNQALSCGNRPPQTAFPTLPVLPPLPQVVDPDAWLDEMDGWCVERKVQADGRVTVDLRSYFISSRLTGQRVSLRIDAPSRSLQVFHQHQFVKTCPLKGLAGEPLPMGDYLTFICHQARAQARLRSLHERRARITGFASP